MLFTRTNQTDEVTVSFGLNEVGRFTVYRANPWSIGIYVEAGWRGQGLARRMMNAMLEEWTGRNEYDPDRMLYIDTDASGGFWDHIGMKPNPQVEVADAPQYGYEKQIMVKELDHYLNFYHSFIS